MYQPDREAFSKLVADHDIIPVYCTIPADLETPVSIFLKTVADSKSILLESGDLGEKARYSFIGSDPFLSVFTEGERTVVEKADGTREIKLNADPLKVVEDIIHKYKVFVPSEISSFWGGAVGFLGYDMVNYWDNIPSNFETDRYPLCHFIFPGEVMIYDHRRHLLTLVRVVHVEDKTRDNVAEVYAEALQKLEETANCLKNSPSPLSEVSGIGERNESQIMEDEYEFTEEEFVRAVQTAKEYIASGEIFQVVLSRRAIRSLEVHPFNLYRALRSLNPSPYQFYLSLDEFQLVGASPEMLVSSTDGWASTCPIAGTRPRGKDADDDTFLADELSHDEKEKAEHMMLVDLGRNDLGKVCCYGSVKVNKLLEVEYFSHVMHLVSEVSGKLHPQCGFSDLLRGAFPAGTVTGAPKIRAMEIISELEPVSRGPYAGAVGYMGFNGDMDTCIAIRTMLVQDGQVRVQAGAGIVADSDPHQEYLETEHKMAASMRAIKLAEEWKEYDFNCG